VRDEEKDERLEREKEVGDVKIEIRDDQNVGQEAEESSY